MTYFVYVIDSADDTLYVGHTVSIADRMKAHRCEPWGERITSFTVKTFRDKHEALAHERDLIADLEPEFNVQGNPRHMSWEQFLGWSGLRNFVPEEQLA